MDMVKDIKRKSSFATPTVDHFSPTAAEGWPKAINVILSFEEALKLHLGLGQIHHQESALTVEELRRIVQRGRRTE